MTTENEKSRRRNAKKKEKREKFYDTCTAFRDHISLENVNCDIYFANVVKTTLMDYEELKGNIIGKLFVSKLIIAEGGTIIYEGLHNSDKLVAVKRIVRQGSAESKEYQSLRAIEVHQNIIRLIDYEKDDGYEYLAFERCLCDLFTLFRAPADTQNDKALCAWKKPSSPSDLACRLRAVIAGVVHLHDGGFAHTKLKPHNVLISAKKLLPRISNLGHCQKLDDNKDALLGMDSFSLGCIIFFCFSQGENPFVSDEWEEAKIVDKSPKLALLEKFHEASHLIVNLLQPQLEKRLVAKQALNHPLFWKVSNKYRFLCEVSDWLEWEANDQYLVSNKLRTAGSKISKIFYGWDVHIYSELITYSTLKRSNDPIKSKIYNYSSLEDLLIICRNTLVHHQRLPLPIKEKVGSDPSQIYEYFEGIFPNMFIEVYDAVYQVCPTDPTFQGYFSIE